MSAGCSVYDESLLSLTTDEGCGRDGSEFPVDRPTIADGPAEEDVPELVYALRDVILDTTEADEETGEPYWKTIGFNLDRRCTTMENKLFACIPPGMNPKENFDGFRGIDNAFGPGLMGLVDIRYRALEAERKELDPNYVSYAPDLQTYSERVLAEGRSSILLRLRRWNGKLDDPSVTIDVSQSVYGMPGDGSDTVPTYIPGSIPQWAGEDWFWARDDTFSNGDPNSPKTSDTNAYIRNGKIVMRLPDRAELVFVGPTLGLRVALVQGIGTATITATGRIDDVRIGGRWTRPDLLETSKAVGVCPSDTAMYALLMSAIDNSADIRSSPENDGDGAPCDAVSFGVSFRAVRARFAGLAPGAPLPNPCE